MEQIAYLENRKGLMGLLGHALQYALVKGFDWWISSASRLLHYFLALLAETFFFFWIGLSMV